MRSVDVKHSRGTPWKVFGGSEDEGHFLWRDSRLGNNHFGPEKFFKWGSPGDQFDDGVMLDLGGKLWVIPFKGEALAAEIHMVDFPMGSASQKAHDCARFGILLGKELHPDGEKLTHGGAHSFLEILEGRIPEDRGAEEPQVSES